MRARACLFAPADGCTSLLKKEIVQIPLKDEIPERQICLVYDSQHPMGAGGKRIKNTNSVELHKRSERTWFIKRGTYPNTSQLMSREHFPSISDAILIHLTPFR